MLINGEILYTVEYNVKKPKGTVIFVHGIAEHHQCYMEFINFLNKNNYNVFGFDLRGHGRSGGGRGKAKNIKQLIEDLRQIVDHVKSNTDGKVFIVGHSMGALIANLYEVNGGKVDGIVASGATHSFVKSVWFLRIFPYKLIGWIPIKTDFRDKRLVSTDEVDTGTYEGDPYLLDRFYISLIGATMVSGIRMLRRKIKNYETPVLVLHGEADRIVPFEFGKKLFESLPEDIDKEFISYPGLKHNLYHDKNYLEIYQDIVDWLDKH